MGLFAAFIEARCVSHVKNERICERKLFVAMRGEGGRRYQAWGKLCEEGKGTAHKARQLLGIALHMASYERPSTHTHTLHYTLVAR